MPKDMLFTVEDIRRAERITEGYLAHDDITDLLEYMEQRKFKNILLSDLSDTQKDIITDFCKIRGTVING